MFQVREGIVLLILRIMYGKKVNIFHSYPLTCIWSWCFAASRLARIHKMRMIRDGASQQQNLSSVEALAAAAVVAPHLTMKKSVWKIQEGTKRRGMFYFSRPLRVQLCNNFIVLLSHGQAMNYVVNFLRCFWFEAVPLLFVKLSFNIKVNHVNVEKNFLFFSQPFLFKTVTLIFFSRLFRSSLMLLLFNDDHDHSSKKC